MLRRAFISQSWYAPSGQGQIIQAVHHGVSSGYVPLADINAAGLLHNFAEMRYQREHLAGKSPIHMADQWKVAAMLKNLGPHVLAHFDGARRMVLFSRDDSPSTLPRLPRPKAASKMDDAAKDMMAYIERLLAGSGGTAGSGAGGAIPRGLPNIPVNGRPVVTTWGQDQQTLIY